MTSEWLGEMFEGDSADMCERGSPSALGNYVYSRFKLKNKTTKARNFKFIQPNNKID
jgi:hypothetical protein